MAKYSWLIQMAANGQVGLVGNNPRGIWYISEWQQHQDGTVALIVGRYEDTYVQRDNEWFFSDRQFTLLYRGDPGPADVYAVPEPALSMATRRSGERPTL